ncbi:MAG: ribbon-helix-helix domain-containing protein [Bauldia sp.]|nr:ribbon-helix-helix domain-containing protein [Bauldia sp.]
MAKRSIAIAGHRTSISLEEPFWRALADIAAAEGTSMSALVAAIDTGRTGEDNLSSAIRMYVLDWYRRAARATAGSAEAGERDPARPASAGRPPAQAGRVPPPPRPGPRSGVRSGA